MTDMTMPPKANIGKEYAVLICLMRDPWLMMQVDLKPHHFQIPQARQIFTVMDAIKNKYTKGRNSGGPGPDFTGTNMKVFAKECRITVDQDVLETLYDRLTDERNFSSSQFESYVESVKNASLVSKMLAVNEEISELIMKHNVEEDPLPLLHDAENKILSLENEVVTFNEPVALFDEKAIEDDLEEYRQNAAQGKDPGILTGFQQLDDRLLGLRPGSLTVIGARAKVGKSALALNIAINVARRYGSECPILYLDTEMSTKEQRSRALSILSGVPENDILKGRLNSVQQRMLDKAKEEFSKLHIYHVYIPGFTAESVLATARRWYNSHKIRFLIFDYIKLPDEANLKAAQEYQILGYFTSMLKNKIAGTLQIPVLTFGQLNRTGVTQAESGDADESSISGSDRIIHYCSNYLVYRKANNKELESPENEGGPHGNRKLHVVVTRNGGDGDSTPITLSHRAPFKGHLTVIEAREVVLETDKKFKGIAGADDHRDDEGALDLDSFGGGPGAQVSGVRNQQLPRAQRRQPNRA